MVNGAIHLGKNRVNSPNRSIDRTFRAVFNLPDPRKKRKKGTKPQKAYRNPIILARQWQEALDRGEYRSQADLARKKRISRARVTQILNLLKLDAEVQEMIVKLGDPLPSGRVTERKLRGLSSLSARHQTKKLEILLSSR